MPKAEATPLPERANLREVGGYQTRSGGTVARGRLYRGAELCARDPAVVRHLVEVLGVSRVIDLRMEGEVDGGPCANLPAGCERLHVPLFAAVLPHWAKVFDRSPEATSLRYYEMLLEGRPALGRIVEMLGDGTTPTFVHCVAGRDRTGIVVACVLDLLDVPEETIAADYALSSVMDDAEGRSAHPENIVRLLDLVRAGHGSTRGMLLDAGVPAEAIERLRASLVSTRSAPSTG